MGIDAGSDFQPFMKKSIYKIAIDILKYIPSRLFTVIAIIFLLPFCIKMLNNQQAGLYTSGMAILTFLPIVFCELTSKTALRFYNEYQGVNSATAFFSSLAMMFSINISFMYILCYIFSDSLIEYFKIPSNVFFVILLIILPLTLRDVLFEVLRAQLKPLTLTNLSILNQCLTLALIFLSISIFKTNIIGVFSVMGLSLIIIDIFLIKIINLNKLISIKNIRTSSLKSFYKYGIPIVAAGLAILITKEFGIQILKNNKSLYMVKLFITAYTISFMMILPIFSTLSFAGIPRIINKYNLSMDIRPILNTLTKYYILISAPFILILCLYANDVIALIAPKTLIKAGQLLPYFAVSAFISGLAEFTTLQYYLVKKTYIDTGIKILALLTVIILIFSLLPAIGLLAIGISFLLGHVLYLVLSLSITNNHLAWNPDKETIKLTAKSLLASLITIFLAEPHDLFAATIIILAAYLLTIMINRVIKN